MKKIFCFFIVIAILIFAFFFAIEHLFTQTIPVSGQIVENEQEQTETTPSVPSEEVIDGDNGEVTATGSCGATLTWSYYGATGTLIISGAGAMTNYTSTTAAPWQSYLSDIKTVIVEEGVESIGAYAFNRYTSITSISLPEGLTSMGERAFFGCRSLNNLTIPKGDILFGRNVFTNCTGLTTVTVEGNIVFSDYNSSNYRPFYNCNNIVSVVVKGSATTIPPHLFQGLTSLTDVILEEGVRFIGHMRLVLVLRLSA